MARSPRPATILLLDHVSEISGAQASLLALLSALDRAAFRPVVVLPSAGPLADALTEMGVAVRFAPLVRLKRTRDPLALARTAWRIGAARRAVARVMLQTGARLIHANSTAAALQTPRLRGVPVVWHCRDLVRLGPLARILRARSAAVVAISRAVGDHLAHELGDARKVRVIYNGVDTARFCAGPADARLRAQLGAGPEHLLVGMVAQLVPWKGQRIFLQAAARAAQRAPHARFAVIGADLFGDHPKYERGLRDLSRALGIAPRVVFAGQRTDVPEVMRALDVVVQPSAPEPFGRAVAEAMSTARPVIAVDEAGPAEIVVDGVSGVLVPRDDPEAVAEAVVALGEDPERAARMGAAARERIIACFSLQAHARAVEALYRELTGTQTP
jgi:glycosyltransferase involved in cell wall biosynthesis